MTGHIYLVDDDSGFRTSLAEILSSVGFSCTEWDTPEDLLDTVQFIRPGCVVLDYRLPALSGLEVLRKVRQHSSIPVVLISAYADVRLSVTAMQTGAAAVFEKPLDDNEFLGFVERLCYEDRDHTTRYQKCLEIRNTISQLSDPEREVLELLRKGMPNKVIAGRLNKSVKAVERNRQTLLAKLNCATTLEALLRVSVCPMARHAPLTCNGRACFSFPLAGPAK